MENTNEKNQKKTEPVKDNNPEKKPDKTEHDYGVLKPISPSESDYIFWTG